MPRFALLLEYNGSPFSGWQRQAHAPSIQATVETALAALASDPIMLAAAGRTDAGVHATGQVAHVDLTRNWDPFRLSEALNYHLKPAPVAVRAVARVDDDWHARFSAVARHYTFRLLNRRAPAAILAGQVWQVAQPLDAAAMHLAAQSLVGHHDFTTFRASECQADSPMRTLDRLNVQAIDTQYGREILFDVRARSFLHSQVRSFVGTLERVGAGAWPPDRVATALAARNRAACGPVCPPHGLYLSRVVYSNDPFAL